MVCEIKAWCEVVSSSGVSSSGVSSPGASSPGASSPGASSPGARDPRDSLSQTPFRTPLSERFKADLPDGSEIKDFSPSQHYIGPSHFVGDGYVILKTSRAGYTIISYVALSRTGYSECAKAGLK
jgi:hypothetical protein